MTEQISVKLSLSIIYVYGTVNGEEAEFVYMGDGVWQAIVEKATEGKYEVYIIAYNSLGSQTIYETVIYKLDGMIDPKCNWTRDDFYNAEDLVRVEANIQYIADNLLSLGYHPELGPLKADWTMQDFPYIRLIKQIDENIDKLRESFYTPEGFQDKKDWENEGHNFSYEDANRFEKNLYLLDHVINLLRSSVVYSGTFYSGQEVVL